VNYTAVEVNKCVIDYCKNHEPVSQRSPDMLACAMVFDKITGLSETASTKYTIVVREKDRNGLRQLK
jgi:hypothetical protein